MNISQEFRELGLSEEMLQSIAEKGFETPSPIQKLTIPVLMGQGNDIIAQAQTGTGKTAAFGLPILDTLKPAKKTVQALVLVPTRELAIQVTEELLSFNRSKKLSISAIYGGASMTEQLRRLAKGIDIVVGTPGRILDHMRRKTLILEQTQYLILDEADEMLNMGFIEDIEEIMAAMDESKRVLLFSATMPQRIVQLSKKYMHDTELLKVEAAQLTTDLTSQIYFEVRESDKFDALTRIIDVEPDFYGIVFSRTKVGVDEIVNKLLERGYAADGLHGDVSQAQREKTLRKFRTKKINILVATDVAARGIDINNLTHVINYSLPQDPESYVHRIGRTGRAGNEGTAITFISNSELRQFGFMKKAINADIKKESLPTPQDIVAMKRNKIKEDLREIIESGSYDEYAGMAGEILGEYDATVALGSLLRLAFRNELSESGYTEIRGFSVDKRGKARLFLSIGRMDGYDARKMVALLKRECGLTDSKIDDVRVMDSYSFVTVPFNDADTIVKKLNKLGRGNRPVAKISKDPEGGGPRKERGDRKGRTSDRSERQKEYRSEPRHKSGGKSFPNSTEVESGQKDANSGSQHRSDKLSEERQGKTVGKKAIGNSDDWFSEFEKIFGDRELPAGGGSDETRGNKKNNRTPGTPKKSGGTRKGSESGRAGRKKASADPARKVSRREQREKKGRR